MSTERVALVTGCDSGIGLAIALKFAKLGLGVSISGLGEASLQEAIGQLIEVCPSKDKAKFLSTRADFLVDDQIEPVISRTLTHFGRLDILVNNTAMARNNRGLMDDDFFEDFRNVLKVNLMAPVRLAHLAAPHLKATKGVMISMSAACDRPTISYSVSKAGISMLTKALANALEGTGVRAVALAPAAGSRRTINDQFGLLKEQITDLIVFLASEKASFIHGTVVDIDCGFQSMLGGVSEQISKMSHETTAQ